MRLILMEYLGKEVFIGEIFRMRRLETRRIQPIFFSFIVDGKAG